MDTKGEIREDINCALKALSRSSSFTASKSRTASSCLLKSWISLYPVYISVMAPFSFPRVFCWPRKSFWLRITTNRVMRTAEGTMRNTTAAIRRLMESIMANARIICRIPLKICIRVCWRPFDKVSRSLVTRLSTSPKGWASKYFTGSLASFFSTASRRSCMALWIEPVRAKAMTLWVRVFNRYSPRSTAIRRPRRSNSTDAPGTFRIRSRAFCTRRVVAMPSTEGEMESVRVVRQTMRTDRKNPPL